MQCGGPRCKGLIELRGHGPAQHDHEHDAADGQQCGHAQRHQRGGAAADATIAAAPGEIERLVLLGTGGGDGPTAKLKGRLLFIVGRDDTNGDGLRLPGIMAKYEKAPQPKKLVLIESSAHAQFLFMTKHGDEVMREIMRFLAARS